MREAQHPTCRNTGNRDRILTVKSTFSSRELALPGSGAVRTGKPVRKLPGCEAVLHRDSGQENVVNYRAARQDLLRFRLRKQAVRRR
jgi:hypothetical protein